MECLPTNIPEHIDVNVEELKIGESIHVKDITPPEEVVFLDDPEQVIVSVHTPQEEEEVVEEIPGEEGAVEPELIKKGKEEEEGSGETAEGEEKAEPKE